MVDAALRALTNVSQYLQLFNLIPVSISMIIYTSIYTLLSVSFRNEVSFFSSRIISTNQTGGFAEGANDVTRHKLGLVHSHNL